MKCQSLISCAVVLAVGTAALAQNTNVVRVTKVTFNETNPQKAFLKPIPIRVNADTTRGAGAVQVRLFPGRTLKNVKKLKMGVTTTGCFILRSRVDSYAPTIFRPDVLIENIDSGDFWCSAEGRPLPTPFVIVVEGAEVGDSPLLRIHPSQMDAYFAHAGEFILKPPPDLRCPKPVKNPQPPPKKPPTAAETAEIRALAESDVVKQHCIEKVQ